MSLSFLCDKEFLRAMPALAVPVAFQQLISAGLNMIDVVMVGPLREASVAALCHVHRTLFDLGDRRACRSLKWINDLVTATADGAHASSKPGLAP